MRVPGSVRRVVIASVVAASCSFGAWAQWPSDPASPLVMGEAQVFGSEMPGLVRTPDGATWFAWVEGQCDGALRVQRIGADGSLLAAGGLVVAESDVCGSATALVAACDDGSIVVARPSTGAGDQGAPSNTMYRIAPDGSHAWPGGVSLPGEGTRTLGALLGVEGGGVVAAWHSGSTVFVGRYDATGAAAWDAPATIANTHGSNMDIVGMVSDGAGGVFVLWDHPAASYFRRIVAARVSGAGAPVWAAPVVVTPVHPFASRHTPHDVVADAQGGVAVFYTLGRESESTIAEVRMQRVGPDGALSLDPAGASASTASTRQFNVRAERDGASGDFLMAWREGGFQTATLHAQRMSAAGVRGWGEHGVDAGPVGPALGAYDAVWDGGRLLIVASETPAPAGEPDVVVWRVSAQGVVAPNEWHVSGASPASLVRAIPLEDGSIAAVWFDGAGLSNKDAVAQRINANGSVGLPTTPGDVNADCATNFADLNVVLANFGAAAQFQSGDLDGDGTVGFADLNLVLSGFGGACDE